MHNFYLNHSQYVRSPHFASIIFITLTTSLLFFNITSHQILHWDDMKYVFNLDYLYGISWNNFLKMLSDFSNDTWYPVTSISFALNILLFETNPIWFKVINIFIHISNSTLFYAIAYKIFSITGRRSNTTISLDNNSNIYPHVAAFISALLFAIHTQHVEAVIWIVGRKDLLCTFFYFLGILCYLQYCSTKNHKWKTYTLICCVLALLSKPMAISFPFVLIVIDLFILHAGKIPNIPDIIYSIKQKLVMIFCCIAIAIVSIFTQSSGMSELQNYSMIQNLINFSLSVWHYLYSIVDPRHLSPYYPHSELVTKPFALSYVALILFFIAFYIFLRSAMKGYTLVSAAILFFLITVFPVSGLIKFSHLAYADRFTYLPLASIYMLIAHFIAASYGKLENRVYKYSLASLLSAYFIFIGFNTHDYISVWANDKSLWEHVNRQFPYKSHAAYVNLGNVYFRQQDHNKALANYHISLGVKPGSFESLLNIARHYQRNNTARLAGHYFQKLASEHSHNPIANLHAGDYFYNAKLYPVADFYYKTALRADPGNTDIVMKNAMLDFVALRHDDALNKVKLLLAINPWNINALKLLVKLKLHAGDFRDAIQISNSILKIDPNDKFARFTKDQYSP